MKSILSSFVLCLLLVAVCHAQEDSTNTKNAANMKNELPYFEIPAEPESFSAENVVARMVDGLGYRYFWATEGLMENDLSYQASETSRTTLETLEHLKGLTEMVLNTVAKKPNIRGGGEKEKLSFEELRKQTLENIKAASDLLKGEDARVGDMKIIFQRGEKKSEFPFWNLLNGPLADALWHTGQIVGNRRASGNPLPAGVNVFMGKTKN